MSRLFRMCCALAALGAFLPAAWAEDAQVAGELRELRQALQQQSKQIELLTQQIGKLTAALAGHAGSESGAGEAERPAPDGTAEIPRAEAVPTAPKHIVVKGETLTSIAKLYNIPLAELQKLNKIEDGRKLQIGQTLTLPTPKNAESPAEKNP